MTEFACIKCLQSTEVVMDNGTTYCKRCYSFIRTEKEINKNRSSTDNLISN